MEKNVSLVPKQTRKLGEECVLDTPSESEKITFNLIHLSVNSLTNEVGLLQAIISARQAQFGQKYDLKVSKSKTSLSQLSPNNSSLCNE